MNTLSKLGAAMLALSLGAGSALAHEGRILAGGTRMVVGFATEPAYEDEMNGQDIFLTASADGGSIDTATAGTTVSLQVKALFLRDDVHVTSETDPNVIQVLDLGNVRKASGTSNTYRPGRFKPTVDGAYGFHITGSITSTSQGVNTVVDEYFVCGLGTQVGVNGGTGRFGCIADAPTIPGVNGPNARDLQGYRDNDEFSLK